MDKIIITTGGTGGHIFPAMAIIEEIRKRFPASEILFIGGENGQEGRIAANAGIPFRGLDVKGFLGKGLKSIPAGFALIRSIFEARKIISEFSPQIMAGCGGYASFAPMLAGLWKRVPCLLHEQNAIAGATNRIMAGLGAKVCVSMPETAGFGKEVEVTGNPVRECFFKNFSPNDKKSRNLLVLGGSQGAHALNIFICGILPILKKANVRILHQTGKKDLPDIQKEYERNGMPADCVKDFIMDMDKAYAWADLVFCRSGASTISELCAMGKPAILVPFPSAIHDHQTFNAKKLEEKGGAILIPQKELSREKTAQLLLDLFADRERLEAMSQSAKQLAKPDAAARIVNLMEKMAHA